MSEKVGFTNYQEYFKNFLGGWSFPNGNETVTISKIEEEEMFDAQTGGKKSGLCIYFKEKELPMVLNVTNAAMIASVLGTDAVAEWIGKKIVVGTENVKAFGKVTKAIRVKDEKPKTPGKKVKPASEAQMNRLKELIADGTINEAGLLGFLGISDISGISAEQALQAIKTKTGEIVE